MAIETLQGFIDALPAKLAGKSAQFNTVYEFNITGPNGAVWTVDLTKEPAVITQGSTGAAKCTVTCGDADFLQIVNGKMNPNMAFMSGKLKIKGDMGLALKLGKLLS